MRILLVEDERGLAQMMRSELSKQGFVVDHAPTLAIAEEAIHTIVHDAVILDRKLPDGDGISFLKMLRSRHPGMPVIVLSAMDTATAKIEGLNRGADDYLTKPFELDELSARLRALLRRPAEFKSTPLQIGNVLYDLQTRIVTIEGAVVELSRREILVLESLIRRAGRTVRRTVIEDEIYGSDEEIQSNSIDAHISRLRRKLSDAQATAEIHAVRGVGYLIKVPA